MNEYTITIRMETEFSVEQRTEMLLSESSEAVQGEVARMWQPNWVDVTIDGLGVSK